MAESEVVDLHVDTFILVRVLGYDVYRRHGSGPFGGRVGYHLDVPRLLEGGVTGAMWSVTTNPLRSARGRFRTWKRNAARLREIVGASEGKLALASTLSEYRAVRATGAHGCLLSIQGGNALDAAPEDDPLGDDALVRVTLVHLTPSPVGGTSSPFQLGRPGGLTPHGRELVRRLDARRVLVDLAHIHPKGFWDAVEVHDRSLPLIVTHTGVNGVRKHWRNLDDDQVRAIADTGGTVGIMLQRSFLVRPGGPTDGAMAVEHMEHVASLVGEDHVSIGTDFDGAITPPADLRSGDTAYLRLVQHMLDRGWAEGRIRKVLGENALRVLGMIRP